VQVPSRAQASSRQSALHLLLALALIPALPASLHAQAPCTAADLDITFRFGNYPPSTYLIAVLAKNISAHACTLTGQSPPRFFSPGQTTPAPIPIHLDAAAQPLTIEPAETAHQTLRWSTPPATNSPACQRATVLSVPLADDRVHPTELLAPTLLPPICSEVAVEPYTLGPTLGDDDAAPTHTLASTLRLTSYRVTYLPGESFSLHAESGTPTPGTTGRGSTRCPPFFLRQRTFAGATRIQEFGPPQIRCMRELNTATAAPDSNPDPYLTTAFEAVVPIQGPTLGDTAVQLFELATSLRDPLIALTASNSITLHISDQTAASATLTAPDAPASFASPVRTAAPADLTAYTGWQTAFTLADTSFGKRTALLDQATHLAWLRLSESRNKSQEELRRNMSPRKPLDGWRFATDDEVATFFRHFTGSPSGRTSDPAIVAELQRLMGGPLTTSHSSPNNWSRAVTNGRIAGYYAPTSGFAPAGAARFQYHYAVIRQDTANGEVTAIINPGQTGWIDGDTTSPDTGTFLVRER
jgi:hypothetical protein